jgi:hypothetical protein
VSKPVFSMSEEHGRTRFSMQKLQKAHPKKTDMTKKLSKVDLPDPI